MLKGNLPGKLPGWQGIKGDRKISESGSSIYKKLPNLSVQCHFRHSHRRTHKEIQETWTALWGFGML